MTDEEARLELARTVLRQGELRLQDQLTRAIASDQRASTLAGIFIAAATVSLVAAVAFATAGTPNPPLAAGGIAAAVMLLVAGAYCARAAMPVKFAAVGAVPQNWWEDGVKERPLAECLENESANYQRYISDNMKVIARSGKLLRCGAGLGWFAPQIGVVFWLIFWVAAHQ